MAITQLTIEVYKFLWHCKEMAHLPTFKFLFHNKNKDCSQIKYRIFIFFIILFSQISYKCKLSTNMCSANIHTFTVYPDSIRDKNISNENETQVSHNAME